MEDPDKTPERINVTECERCGDSPTSIDPRSRQCYSCDDEHGDQLDIFDEKKSSWNDIMKIGTGYLNNDWAVTDVNLTGSSTIQYVVVENSAGQTIYAEDIEIDLDPNVQSSWNTWGEGSGAGSEEIFEVDLNEGKAALTIGKATYTSPDTNEEIEYAYPEIPEELTGAVTKAVFDNDKIISELEQRAVDSYNDSYGEGQYDDEY
jgi:hypothetical protein